MIALFIWSQGSFCVVWFHCVLTALDTIDAKWVLSQAGWAWSLFSYLVWILLAHWQDYSAWYGTGYKMLCLPLLLVCSTDWVIIVVECSKVNVVNDVGSVCWFSECLSARECWDLGALRRIQPRHSWTGLVMVTCVMFSNISWPVKLYIGRWLLHFSVRHSLVYAVRYRTNFNPDHHYSRLNQLSKPSDLI